MSVEGSGIALRKDIGGRGQKKVRKKKTRVIQTCMTKHKSHVTGPSDISVMAAIFSATKPVQG